MCLFLVVFFLVVNILEKLFIDSKCGFYYFLVELSARTKLSGKPNLFQLTVLFQVWGMRSRLVGKRGIKYLDNNRILKKIGEFLGENIIAPILNRVGDLTAPLVDQIKNAIRRKLEEAQEIARQLCEKANNVIADVTGQGLPYDYYLESENEQRQIYF